MQPKILEDPGFGLIGLLDCIVFQEIQIEFAMARRESGWIEQDVGRVRLKGTATDTDWK